MRVAAQFILQKFNFTLERSASALSADIILVLDESASVDGTEFQQQQSWTKEFIQNFWLVKHLSN